MDGECRLDAFRLGADESDDLRIVVLGGEAISGPTISTNPTVTSIEMRKARLLARCRKSRRANQ